MGMDLLPRDGRTPLHTHPDFEEVSTILTDYFVTPKAKRGLSWQELAEGLQVDYARAPLFPDALAVERRGEWLSDWCTRYLYASWTVPSSFVRNGIVKAEHDLNTVTTQKDLARQLKARFDALMESGKASTKDLTSLASTISQIEDRANEELERWNLIPGKKKQVQVEERGVRVNLWADLDRMTGRSSSPAPKIIEVVSPDTPLDGQPDP